MANEFRAEWSGCYPALCFGEWTLYKNGGEDISEYIPEDLRDSHMNTAGVYSEWHFVDWIEEFSDYEDGMGCHDWIAANKWWLDQFCDTEIDFENVYWAFNASDFRPGSCGGCI